MQSAITRIFSSGRFFIGVAVLTTFISFVCLSVFAFISVIKAVSHQVLHGTISAATTDEVGIDLLKMLDVLLLATVFYIISIGLYMLFIDADIRVPAWLRARDLDDLKQRVVGVLIVLLGMTFLETIAGPHDREDGLYTGIAIAVVMIPLVAMFAANLWAAGKEAERAEHDDRSADSPSDV